MVTKAEAARRLGLSSTAINTMIQKGYLVPVINRNKEMIKDSSLYTELARRFELFGKALSIEDNTDMCLCGCGSHLKTGKFYVQGHDETLERVLQTILRTGEILDREKAKGLAEKRGFDVLKLL